MKVVEKLSLEDLCRRKDWKTAVIVFKEESFRKVFPLMARSYRVESSCKFFDSSYCGRSLYGDRLDGVDNMVRLDCCMLDTKKPWLVDYCYIEK